MMYYRDHSSSLKDSTQRLAGSLIFAMRGLRAMSHVHSLCTSDFTMLLAQKKYGLALENDIRGLCS